MKKITLWAILCIVCLSSNAQENKNQTFLRNHEVKINMSNLIGFKWLDVSYERILNEESSIGVSVLLSLDSEIMGLDEYRTFSITPYYRHFFSNKYARGFFVEAFTMLHSGKEEFYYSNSYPYDSFVNKKFTDLAAGISVGGKFVTKRGFITEIHLGIGRDLLGSSDMEIVGRGGVSIGYRFH